jgi:hypothetical protein
MESPNFKHQISNKSQSPKFKTKYSWLFEIGIWNLRFGILATADFAKGKRWIKWM